MRPAATAPATPAARRPFRDNPRLILAGIVMLLAVLAGLLVVEERTSRLAPDFLAEVVLYALSATNLTMLLALVFLLARNVIKSIVEGRRGLPFARFRAKLVLAMLGMTVIPAVLVLLVGSRVVLTAVDRWFNTPVDEILSSANSIAADYYQEQQRAVSEHAAQLADELARLDLAATDVTRVRALVSTSVTGPRPGLVQVYRVSRGDDGAAVGGAGGRRRVADHPASLGAGLDRTAGQPGRQRRRAHAVGARAAS